MNQTGRLLAVGDIHGCIEKLEVLIKVVSPQDNDTVVFLGDYINRGPNSKGVIDYLLRFRENIRTIFLMGNHEKMFLDYIYSGTPSFLLNGGASTLQSYSLLSLSQMPEKHLQFLKDLLPYFEAEEFIFVHAGLRPEITLQNQSIDDLLWLRDEFLNSDFDWGKTIIYGHTVYHEPEIKRSRIGIDTGCSYCRGREVGNLTCIDVRKQQIWSV